MVIIVAMLATLVIAFVKGAFGGGFGLVGIPLLSLVVDPITAGVIMAPLFIPMDLVALRYFPLRTWSKPDLVVLVPALMLGIALGTLTLTALDTRLVSILIAVVALAFAAQWYLGGQTIDALPRRTWLAVLAGTASGVTTMIVHSGAPPLVIYLLRRGLSKESYVGTLTIYFAIGNIVKVWPWIVLAHPTTAVWWIIAACVPVAVFGVWLGWQLHRRLGQRQLYQACYALLVVASVKMLWDGMSGYL